MVLQPIKRLLDKRIGDITPKDKLILIGVAFMVLSIIIFFLFFLKPVSTPAGIYEDVTPTPAPTLVSANETTMFGLFGNVGGSTDSTIVWVLSIALVINILMAASMRRGTGIIFMVIFAVIVIAFFPNIPFYMKVAVMGAPLFMFMFKMRHF